MATRSRIGIELKDGSILSAYHHWDGYPTVVGSHPEHTLQQQTESSRPY